MKLLPIGTRVSHFGRGPKDGHGHGEIIAYNGQQPNHYFQEKPLEATELAASLGTMGLDALVNSMYDGQRCPYLVRWDPNPEFFKEHPHLLKRFPNMQYEDVYEAECLVALEKEATA